MYDMFVCAKISTLVKLVGVFYLLLCYVNWFNSIEEA